MAEKKLPKKTKKQKLSLKDSYVQPKYSLSENDEIDGLQDIFTHSILSQNTSLEEFEKEQKIQEKLRKKQLQKTLLNDKFSKNVILARKSIRKKDKEIVSQNKRRTKRCNEYILSHGSDYRDIYLTIDKFNNNGKRTICYFIDSFYPCIDGVLSVMENYVSYMQKYYNVVVCAPKHKQKEYKIDKYFVLYSDSVYIKKQGYDLAFPQFDGIFQKYISLLKIDLIHLQSPFNMGSFGLNLAKRRKIPCFITFHSQFKLNFYDAVKNETIANWLTKIVMNTFNRANLALTMNPFARNIMREYGMKKQVEIVPNATNLVPKTFDEDFENSVLRKYHIKKDTFNMIFIGRFVAVKNVYFMIECLKDLKEKNKDFCCVFMGFGPEMEKMKKTCEEYNLSKNVVFTGKVSDEDEKSVIIKNSKLMFFPSLYEIDSIVRIEAACYSVPTLCVENTSLSSVMTDNHNGFICKNDKDEIVNRLDFLIKNVDFVEKVGKNANLEIYFTWDKPCSRLRELYEKYFKVIHIKNMKNSKEKSKKQKQSKMKK